MKAKRSKAPRLATSHVAALIAIVVLAVACIVSAADRAGLNILGGGSCKVPTPRSCITQLAFEYQQGGPERVLERSAALARSYPGLASVQALHGAFLSDAGQINEGAKFLLNSARLGWREPAGQSLSYLIAVDDNDAPRAILHLDTLLKLDPGRIASPQLMAPVYAKPALRSEFAARLASGAPYLPQVLRSFADDRETAWDQRIGLLDEARQRGLRVPDVHMQGSIRPLFRTDPFKALDFWLALNGPGDFANNKLAWDSDLSEGDVASAIPPFQWHDRGNGDMLKVDNRGGSPTFMADGNLSGPARDLVAIAVPLRPGGYPVEWNVIGAPDAFFLSASCVGSARAELTDISPVTEGRKTAIMIVEQGCAMPVLSIAKSRGDVGSESGIGSIEIAGRAVLD